MKAVWWLIHTWIWQPSKVRHLSITSESSSDSCLYSTAQPTQQAGGSVLLPLGLGNLDIAVMLRTHYQFPCVICSNDWLNSGLPAPRTLIRWHPQRQVFLSSAHWSRSILFKLFKHSLAQRKRRGVFRLAARTTPKKPNYSLLHTKFPLYHSDHVTEQPFTGATRHKSKAEEVSGGRHRRSRNNSKTHSA